MKEYFHSIATDQRQGFIAGIIKVFLWILSWLYLGIIQLRNGLFQAGIMKSTQLQKPVISVGNLTWGGSGKTPLVEYLARLVQKSHKKPVILTRGYMADGRSARSDEAKMLEERLTDVPVLVGSNRIKNAQAYVQSQPVDVFLLDDGFQHRQIKRDLNILAIDATNPWGNEQLIPRGILREPAEALSRATVCVITKADMGQDNLPQIHSRIESIEPKIPVVEAKHEAIDLTDMRLGENAELSKIHGKKVCLVSSIAGPQSFKQTVALLDADVRKHFVYLDHHHYRPGDIAEINQYYKQEGIDCLVTTHKDAVKLQSLLPGFEPSITLYCLNVVIKILKGEDELVERVNRLS